MGVTGERTRYVYDMLGLERDMLRLNWDMIGLDRDMLGHARIGYAIVKRVYDDTLMDYTKGLWGI